MASEGRTTLKSRSWDRTVTRLKYFDANISNNGGCKPEVLLPEVFLEPPQPKERLSQYGEVTTYPFDSSMKGKTDAIFCHLFCMPAKYGY